MIVVSGVLVLVALVFLVIGLVGSGLGFIWASIVTSVVAGVFLLLGALQRRGAPAPAAASGTTGSDMLEHVTAVSVRPREEEAAAPAAAEPAAGPEVSVVPGRPRYHVAGCRFLTGRPDVQTLPVDEARGEGYTACGVCKPDAALDAATPPPADEPVAAPEPVADEVPDTEPEPATDDTDTLTDVPVLAETGSTTTRARKAPAKKAAAARGSRTTATAAAEEAPAAAPAKAAAKKAPAKAATGNQVVVIPDRPKFHVETCRFVRDVPGTLTVTKATAKRQGYTPCGVCKP